MKNKDKIRIYEQYLKICGEKFDVVKDGKMIAQDLAVKDMNLCGSRNFTITSYKGWDFYELWDENSKPKPNKPVIVWEYYQWGIFAINYFRVKPLSTQKILFARDILKEMLDKEVVG
jgi:hypothetical protein